MLDFSSMTESVSSTLPTKDPGNAVIQLQGESGAVFEFTAVSTATGVFEALYSNNETGAVWHAVSAFQYTPASNTLYQRAPGATVTLALSDIVFVFAPGARALRFNLGGTSATVKARTFSDAAAFNAWASGFSSKTKLREVTLTFSTDTNVYADNDVLADSQLLAAVVRQNDAKGYLVAFEITDEDDNTAIDMDLVLLSANVSLGTENAAVSISDANARNIIAVINILSTEWNDHINSKVVTYGGGKSPLPIPITPVSGSDDIYVGLIVRSGTPTYTASGLTARFWFLDAE